MPNHVFMFFSYTTFITQRKRAQGIFSYTHDVNRRIKSPIAWSTLNIVNATAALERLANQLKTQTDGDVEDVDILSAQSENGIYDVSKENCDERIIDVPEAIHLNCNSTHFKAIAAINLFTYNILCKNDDQHEDCKIYLQNWLRYENLALKAEDAEVNTRCMLHDSKKMLNLIDWKDKGEITRDNQVNEPVINSYFTKIFQSDKTKNHPVVTIEVLYT